MSFLGSNISDNSSTPASDTSIPDGQEFGTSIDSDFQNLLKKIRLPTKGNMLKTADREELSEDYTKENYLADRIRGY